MRRRSFLKPLEDRVFKYKKPTMRFFCPLCRTERSFTSSPRLNFKHYIQILMTTIFLMLVLYPFIQMKSLFTGFIVWMCFEFFIRMNFKKQIPCEHCGFDASWYHRDIPTTRKRVEEFWKDRGPDHLEIPTAKEAPPEPEVHP